MLLVLNYQHFATRNGITALWLCQTYEIEEKLATFTWFTKKLRWLVSIFRDQIFICANQIAFCISVKNHAKKLLGSLYLQRNAVECREIGRIIVACMLCWRAKGASLAIVIATSLIKETLVFGLGARHGVVHEVLVLVLDAKMSKYKNTWIIALAIRRRRRIRLVFMALSIGCYFQFITSSWKITALQNVTHDLDC